MKSESSDSPFSPGGPADGSKPDRESLETLRDLIVGAEREQIEDLRTRLDDPETFALEISRVIPQAILLRSTQDRKLTQALTPTIEEAIKSSVNRNPQPIVDAIAPAMGPSIRKAIAETIRRMIQSFNQALERSMSWQGLKWRVESWRTGKSFAEVVMLHNLVYRVEQVFLIHRESGLSLHHVLAEDTIAQDADLVSAMLTAIRDFVHDSFKTEQEDTLDTMEIGDRTVWVESGSNAVLAAVIRGTPPMELRDKLRETIEQIHLVYREKLSSFGGDTAPFEPVRPLLLDCLQTQYREKRRRISPLFWIIVLAVITGLGAGTVWMIQRHQSAQIALDSLLSEPGITILNSNIRHGTLHVSGFRDPLARDPSTVLAGLDFPSDRIAMKWELFDSLNPAFVMKRARHFLNPPPTVELTLAEGILHFLGHAPHRWITELPGRAMGLTGVHRLEWHDLIDDDVERLKSASAGLKNLMICFDTGKPDLPLSEVESMEKITSVLNVIFTQLDILDEYGEIELTGHTDISGTESLNKELSLKRAQQVESHLIDRGIPSERITVRGVGSSDPVCSEDSETCRQRNRSVTFRLVGLSGPLKDGGKS
ncbi:OmpA family protein [bacterium]|nr:OmpA family protein [candidate division CSSED10-310 bacterium]